MFKKGFFIYLFLFCSFTFGEQVSEQKNSMASEGAAAAKTDGSLIPSEEMEQNPLETLTSHQFMEDRKEWIRLEGIGGLSVTETKAFTVPLALEIQGLLIGQKIEELKWLLQIGGVALGTVTSGTWIVGVSSLLQVGLKYRFSEEFYGSFKGGAIHIHAADRVWTGGLFFGQEMGAFIIEGGIQSFYLGDRQWDLGVGVSIGFIIRKWQLKN